MPDSVYDKGGLGIVNFGEGDLLVSNKALAEIIKTSGHFTYDAVMLSVFQYTWPGLIMMMHNIGGHWKCTTTGR